MIFLSYASEQRQVAEEIKLALASSGHHIFFDRDSLPVGDEYHLRIRKAVEESEGFVFLMPKMREKYFAPRGSITHDRSLVNGLDHPELSWIGGFSRKIRRQSVNPVQMRWKKCHGSKCRNVGGEQNDPVLYVGEMLRVQSPDEITNLGRDFERGNRHAKSSVGEKLVERIALPRALERSYAPTNLSHKLLVLHDLHSFMPTLVLILLTIMATGFPLRVIVTTSSRRSTASTNSLSLVLTSDSGMVFIAVLPIALWSEL
jgi:hypothetical protein